MGDVRRLYAEQIEAARLALGRGDRAAAAVAFRWAIDVSRGEPGLAPELVPVLVHLGKLEQELGRPADAERVLYEALATGERCFGAEHPSLGAVLNELSRLHIRQSQPARAETVLERLLRITRAKGEQHPDVATALAGLALVKRALGDQVSAEQHFRDALRIRERALAPQHMSTVVTMEQLSETCAACGNLAEALELLQRALPTRETALGAEHATVRALRSRIAALELRVLEATLPSAEQEIASLAESAASAEAEAPAPSIASTPVAPIAPSSNGSTRPPRKKRLALFASVGVTAVALATVGLGDRSPADLGRDQVSASTGTETHFVAHTRAPAASRATTLGVATMEAVQRPSAPLSVSDTSTAIVQAGAPMSEAAAPTPAPRLPVVPKNLAAVTARLIARTNVDSMVRASTKLDRAVSNDQIGTRGGLLTSSHPDDAGAKPAVLIAPAPLPRFPEELRSHWSESEVVVRFRVDARGRVDVSSMKVLQSDHELFTEAVRNALPRFRFQPARSAAPESKPVADWVDFRVRFAMAK
jgi:TonB family protein